MPETIQELVAQIEYHQDLYYNGSPEISDAAFDALWDRLSELDPDNAILQRVGRDENTAFEKREHLMRMGSQEKASNPEQFRKWAARVNHAQWIVQHKLDGASLELQYRGGQLQYAVTRGDGFVGDDITRNVRKMQGVLATVPGAFTGAVRGEVVMTHTVHREHFSDKANCRNAANGLMKRKDGIGSEYLTVMVYDAHAASDTPPFQDELQKLAWLERLGFIVVPYDVFATPEEIISYRDEMVERRATLEVDIDGLVVKGVAIDRADMERARPQKQIAFKFSAEEAITVLRDVEWSESGHLYTPVGLVEPVTLAGTTVQRASLVHPELIAEMDLKIGSEVVITKRGDIIPKIERLVRHRPDARSIQVPSVCSTCGSELVNEGKRLYCPNQTCPRRDFHRLQKWIEILDVRDFGDVMLTKLFEHGQVREIADLYRLSWEDLAKHEGVGEISARKALTNLRTVDTIPLARFVAGFDIAQIAELKVQKVVDAGFTSLEALRAADVATLSAVPGIAEKTAELIVEGLIATSEMMDRVLATGAIAIATPEANDAERQPLAGMVFCFTGTLEGMKRSEAEELVRRLGGAVRSSVSGALSYLVTDDPASGSTKARKATELGVPVLSGAQFRALTA